MSTGEKVLILEAARMLGRQAPLDAAPEFTEEGLKGWHDNIVAYFEYACDRFVKDMHLTPKDIEEEKNEILNAMGEGFKSLVQKQPYIKNPEMVWERFVEAPPRPRECGIVDHIFHEELPQTT